VAMIRKSAIILICFLSLIFISPGEVFPEIPQNGHTLSEANHDNRNLIEPHLYGGTRGFQNLDQRPLVSSGDSSSLNSFTSPRQTGINLANANDASSMDNVGAIGSGTEPGSQSVGENPNYKFGYNGNSYTINFFNINYGDLFEKRPSERFIGGERNCYPQGLKDALRRLAEERGIQEMEQKENLQLLKQIALG
jgi:hypothetical protein